MKHCLIWRNQQPTVVSFLGNLELSAESYTTLSAALLALSILKGW